MKDAMRFFFRAALLLLLLVAWLSGCATDQEIASGLPRERGPKAAVKWDLREPSPGHPNGQAYLVVAGQSHLLEAQPAAPFQPLARWELADYHITKKAILGAYSWHAGFGEILYVVPSAGQYQVYRQEMDEEEHSRYEPKLVMTIPVQQG